MRSLLFARGERNDVKTEARSTYNLRDLVSALSSGSGVTPSSVQSIDTALGSSVVWRCAMKNAATLSTFPVHTKSDRVTVPDSAIVRDPAGDGSLQSVWVFSAALSMYLRGAAYGLVGPSMSAAMGRPNYASLVHPDRVEWSSDRGWTLDGDKIDLWPLGPLWHCPMYVMPGSPKGLNPLQYARRSLYPGMAAQEFGANFFRDGGHPSSIMTAEGPTQPNEEQAKALKKRVMDVSNGTNREPLFLPGGIKWQPIQVNPDDSQFIDAQRLSDEQVCRYMGCPPEEVGVATSGSSLTYANREQNKQNYLQELLMPMQRIEGSWSSLLSRPRSVQLSPAGLLRADLKARYESYKLSADVYAATGSWIVTPDEWRAFEDLEPLPAPAL